MFNFNTDELISKLKTNDKYLVKKNTEAKDSIYGHRKVRVYISTPKKYASKKADGWSIVHHIIRDFGFDQMDFLQKADYNVFENYIML